MHFSVCSLFLDQKKRSIYSLVCTLTKSKDTKERSWG